MPYQTNDGNVLFQGGNQINQIKALMEQGLGFRAYGSVDHLGVQGADAFPRRPKSGSD